MRLFCESGLKRLSGAFKAIQGGLCRFYLTTEQ